MKLPNIGGLFTVGKAVVAAHRPEILFGTSIVTTLAAVVAAAKGGYKSGQQVLREEFVPDAGDELIRLRELSTKEIAKLTWMNYLPSAGITAAALGATTGLHIVHINEKKAIAATALLAIEEVKQQSKEWADDVQASIDEALTDKQKAKVESAVMEKTADRNGGVVPYIGNDGIINELYLVRDAKTGRDVWSNEHIVEEAMMRVNQLLTTEGACDLDTFYTWAGFATIPEGGDMGWGGGDLVQLVWDNSTRDDSRPVRQFTFRPAPRAGAGR